MKPRRSSHVGAMALLLALPAAAEPCTCAGEWPLLPKLMRRASLAVTGEVVAHGPVKGDGPEEVTYLDLRIIKKLRGRERRTTVRIWDSDVTTSCAHGLGLLPVGSYVAIVAKPASSEPKEYLELIGIRPAPEDYVVGGACGEYRRRLESAEAARSFPRKPPVR